MREVRAEQVESAVAALIKRSLVSVEPEVVALMEKRRQSETGLSAWALDQILENDRLAAETGSYACQDTGLAVLFVEVGQDVHIIGDLSSALQAGTAEGYREARKSVADPLTRINTGTNTPAVIHYDIVPGENLSVTYLAKGAGSENMSALYMLTPSKGRAGIVASVVDCVKKAGASPCPPIIIGLGIGGTMERAAVLSKRALTRPTGQPSSDPIVAALESEILTAVNALGVGVQGFGGATTALAVQALTCPTHIGMLPVAVNIQCHSVRHGTVNI